jgi:hypothetical protein
MNMLELDLISDFMPPRLHPSTYHWGLTLVIGILPNLDAVGGGAVEGGGDYGSKGYLLH